MCSAAACLSFCVGDRSYRVSDRFKMNPEAPFFRSRMTILNITLTTVHMTQLHNSLCRARMNERRFGSASTPKTSAAAESGLPFGTTVPVPPVLPPTAVEKEGPLRARQTPIALRSRRLSSTNSLVISAKVCLTIPLHYLTPLVHHAPPNVASACAHRAATR